MATAQHPAHDRDDASSAPEGWPDVIRSKVFVGREDDQYFALVLDFDIASQGPTPDEAVESVGKLLCSYLESSLKDRLPYDEVRRPVPAILRLKLHAQAVIRRRMRGVVRADGAQERELEFPAGVATC